MRYASFYAVSGVAVCVGLPLAVAGAAMAVPAVLAAVGVLLVAFGLGGVYLVLSTPETVPVLATVGWASDAVPVTVGWASDRPARKPRSTRKSTPVVKAPVKRVAARASTPAKVAPRQTTASPRKPRVRKSALPT